MTDEYFMNIAIDIASKSKYPFGAIIVRNDEIIGRSDSMATTDDCQASTHAEMRAIQDAIDEIGGYLSAEGGKDCTLYTSCEPCLMCMGAVLYTAMGRLVYAANLDDASKCVNEIFAAAEKAAEICANRTIEIVPEFQRGGAIEVMEKWIKEAK